MPSSCFALGAPRSWQPSGRRLDARPVDEPLSSHILQQVTHFNGLLRRVQNLGQHFQQQFIEILPGGAPIVLQVVDHECSLVSVIKGAVADVGGLLVGPVGDRCRQEHIGRSPLNQPHRPELLNVGRIQCLFCTRSRSCTSRSSSSGCCIKSWLYLASKTCPEIATSTLG